MLSLGKITETPQAINGSARKIAVYFATGKLGIVKTIGSMTVMAEDENWVDIGPRRSFPGLRYGASRR